MSRIFDPKPREIKNAPSDFVGRFRSGHQVNNLPVSLTDWRVTSDDKEVLEALRKQFGGDPIGKWNSKKDDIYELFTEASKVDIILDVEKGIDASFLHWPERDQNFIVDCRRNDVDIDPEKPNAPIPCEYDDFSSKAEFIEKKHRCTPGVKVRFRLADLPELGEFDFHTKSWQLIESLSNVFYDLQEYEGSARCTLGLEHVEFTTKAGRHVSYTKPVIEVVGAADESAQAA